MNEVKSKKQKDKLRSAFTLAEVLITLGIIGIVAVMTIPTLMQNIQDAQFKSAWKKEYSGFSQAYTQILNDNGGTILGSFTHVGSVVDSQTMLTMFKDKMKVLQYCDSVDSTNFNCFYPTANPAWVVHAKNGGVDTFSGTGYPALILGDGSLVKLVGTLSGWSIGDVTTYGQIIVDVNGRSGPNIIGRDILGAWILENKLLPWGGNGDTSPYQNTCNTSGYSCSYDYLMQ